MSASAANLCHGLGNLIVMAAEDVGDLQEQLAADGADEQTGAELARVARHLRAAGRLVDSVADRIDAPAVPR